MILHGDCLEVLRTMEPCSVDAIVTDPPYGLAFMGKKWDYDVPSVEVWRKCLRVLKPGGHMMAFGGTRTYHRLVTAIEDAGFEIRDQIQWIFGQGFPKSLDVSKAIDKEAGATREVVGHKGVKYVSGSNVGATGWETEGERGQVTAPATDAAREWEGWGTALKPANEPICLARKPLSESTVAKNVLKHGTGALNIDGCRVETNDDLNGGTYSGATRPSSRASFGNGEGGGVLKNGIGREYQQPTGRFPANLILDEEAAQALDAQSGVLKSGTLKGRYSSLGYHGRAKGAEMSYDATEGGASRFFYVAKASKAERNAGLGGLITAKVNDGRNTPIDNPFQRGETERLNTHPTVKPVALMAYLCRLITPPGGLVLDPFAGSGSTGVGALQEGFRFLGIEREEQYVVIAKRRLEAAV